MTTERRVEERIRQWLNDEASGQLPDWVLDVTFERTRAERQRQRVRGRRRDVLHVPRRYARVTTFFKLTVAAVAVALIGGISLVVLQPKAPPPVGVASPPAAVLSSPAPAVVSSSPTSAATPTSAPTLSSVTPSSTSSAGASTGSAIAIAAGQDHTCAVTRAGGVQCWGSNLKGQLGNGTTTDSATPVDVSGLASTVTAIAAGDSHTCAITSGGGVKCWGWNLYGQLGNGTTNDSATPIDVSGLASGATAIAAGRGWTCALANGGGAKCWGSNGQGQLGNGSLTSTSTPVDVVGLSSGVTAIVAGSFHTCALMRGGGVKCWGWAQGQLGNGSVQSLKPVDVAGLAGGVMAITAGEDHTCVVTNSGGVKCWGINDSGQLGTGSSARSGTPVDVAGLSSGVTAIASGNFHTCALMNGGSVKCWGFNASGQLGNGTTTDSTTPVDVADTANGVTSIAVRADQSCALMTGGAVFCWGLNAGGQLGNGTTTDSDVPVEVRGL